MHPKIVAPQVCLQILTVSLDLPIFLRGPIEDCIDEMGELTRVVMVLQFIIRLPIYLMQWQNPKTYYNVDGKLEHVGSCNFMADCRSHDQGKVYFGEYEYFRLGCLQ